MEYHRELSKRGAVNFVVVPWRLKNQPVESRRGLRISVVSISPRSRSFDFSTCQNI